MGYYPRHKDGDVSANPSFPQLEEQTLKYWKQNDTFRKSIAQREAGDAGANEFVFYDGPPFANGLPHYGHLLTGYVKDVVGRYQTMQGHRVERRFGVGWVRIKIVDARCKQRSGQSKNGR